MKRFSKLFFSFLCLIPLIGKMEVSGKNISIPEDIDIIMERPEGELMYYEARCKYLGGGNLEPLEKTLIIPTVKGNDGEVYMRNPTGRGQCYGAWIKGRLDPDDGNLIFPNGEIVGYYISYGYQYDILGFISYLYLLHHEDDYEWIDNTENEKIVFKALADGSYSYSGTEENTYLVYMTEKIDGMLDQNLNYYYYDPIYEMSLIPSDYQPIMPPTNIEPETYQIKYNSTYDSLYGDADKDETDKERLLNVIIDNEEIYIQGLGNWYNGNDNEAWIKGKIQGDKVIIPNNQVVGVGYNSMPQKLLTLTWTRNEWHGNTTQIYVYFDDADQELEFDYDSEKGVLSHPNFGFGITSVPLDKMTCYLRDEYYYETYIDINFDYYGNTCIEKIPSGLQMPCQPEVRIGYVNNTYYKVPYIYPSYYDTDGYMMDKSHLFLRIWKDGEPYTFTAKDFSNATDTYEDYKSKAMYIEPTQTLPYDYLYKYMGFWDYNSYDGIYDESYYYYICLDFEPTDTELVYIKDGIEYSSKGTISSGVEEIKTDNSCSSVMDGNIYNLNGQRVNPDNLIPGIYIRDGKKFVIR